MLDMHYNAIKINFFSGKDYYFVYLFCLPTNKNEDGWMVDG